MTTVNDLEILESDPTRLTLSTGTEAVIERLRTRQLFRFLKILTVGAGDALASIDISADTDTEELAQNLIALCVISIPEAEDESIDFIKSIVSPADLIDPVRTKDDKRLNDELLEKFYAELDNPEIEDTLEIIQRVIKAESPHMLALGKRLAALLPSAAKPKTSSKKPSAK